MKSFLGTCRPRATLNYPTRFPKDLLTFTLHHSQEPVLNHLLLNALRACGCLRDLVTGHTIHARLQHSNLYVSTTLVSMYSRCGSLLHARMLFNRMPCHTVVTWNALIQGCVENNQDELALGLFSFMEAQGCVPDVHTLTAAAMACTGLAAADEGEFLHGKVVKTWSLATGTAVHRQAVSSGCDSDVFLASTLVGMYSKCGSMTDARMVFDRVTNPDVVLWTTLIIGYTENGQPEVGLELFSRVHSRGGFLPDDQVFLAALMACVGLAEKEEGRAVQGKVVKLGSLELGLDVHSQAAVRGFDRNVYVAATLVDLYSKCGSLVSARRVFERTPYHNVVMWNSLILGCVENGEEKLTLELMSCMRAHGYTPDDRTYVAGIMACGALAAKEDWKQVGCELVKTESLERGMALHSEAWKSGYEADMFVASSLVDMYARCGSLLHARAVFDRSKRPDVALWNALLMGYAENGKPELALRLFRAMPTYCMQSSRTFIAALVACGNMTGLDAGREVHAEIRRRPDVANDCFVANCLVDFYGKCGSMSEAHEVFNAMSNRTLVAWNGLLTGYSRQGSSDKVFELFERMCDGRVQPDGVTYLAVLAACSHAGLVEKGREFFETMKRSGVEMDIEHYHCMVDLLGRNNLLDEAVRLVRGMPYKPNPVTWNIVLGACRKWNNAEVGEVAFQSLLKLEKQQASTFVLMSNIYKST